MVLSGSIAMELMKELDSTETQEASKMKQDQRYIHIYSFFNLKKQEWHYSYKIGRNKER